MLGLLDEFLVFEEGFDKTFALFIDGLEFEIVFGVGGLVWVGDCEWEAIDVDAFAFFELVFGVDDQVVVVLAVVHLN